MRGLPQDAALLDGRLYCALGNGGVSVYDVRDPSGPVRVGGLYLPQEAFAPRRIAVQGARGVTLDAGGQLTGLDLSDPDQPRKTFTTTRALVVDAVGLQGATAVIAAYDPTTSRPRLEFWDLFSGPGPEQRASIAIADSVFAFAFVGPGIVAALGTQSTAVFDCTDPGNPRPLSQAAIGIPFSTRLQIHGTQAMSVPGSLRILDFSQPSQPVILKEQLTTNYVSAATWAGGAIWGLVDGTLRRFSPDGSAGPEASLALSPGFSRPSIVVGNEALLVIGSPSAGLALIDLSSPAAPVIRASLPEVGEVTRARARGNLVFAAHSTAVAIVDIAEPSAPKSGGLLPAANADTQAMDLDLFGDLLVTLERVDRGTLTTWSLSSPTTPTVLQRFSNSGSLTFPRNPQQVRILRDRDILLSQSGPNQVRWLVALTGSSWRLETFGLNPSPVGAVGIAAESGSETIGRGASGAGNQLHVWNPYTGDPGLPLVLSDRVRGIAISGAYACVAANSAGLVIVDATRPSSLRIVGNANTLAPARSVAVRPPYAFVGTTAGTVEVFEVADVTSPRRVAGIATGGEVLDLDVQDSRIYVADGAAGLTLLEFLPSRVPQQILLPRLYHRPTNSVPFVIDARSSAGLPVSLRVVQGPARLAGNECRPAGTPGPVFIRAEQPGDDTYAPAVAEGYFSFGPAPRNAFENWIYARYPWIPSTERSATSDPDADGVPNETEHYFGSDPSVPDQPARLPAPRLETTDQGRFAVIQFRIQPEPVVPIDWKKWVRTRGLQPEDTWQPAPPEWIGQTADQLVVKIPLVDPGTGEAAAGRLVRVGPL